MPKKITTGDQPVEGEQFGQPPMGGGQTEVSLPQYSARIYQEDLRILRMRALHDVGVGAKKYNGYLVDDEGERSYLCEFHQVRKDGKMISIQAVARSADGRIIAPQSPQVIQAFRFTFTEPNELIDQQTGEVFSEPILIFNKPDIPSALKFRNELFVESESSGFSLREIAKLVDSENKETKSPAYPDRALIEVFYEKPNE